MSKLFLFDIDGTLVSGVRDGTLIAKLGEDRFTEAIHNVLGLRLKREKDFRGYTDYQILTTLLEDAGWGEPQVKDAMPALLQALDHAHQAIFRPDSIWLLPGVKELLEALRQHGMVLGLLTGNLQPIAHRKLEALGIWSYFSVGGFGSNPHTARADLVRAAVNRAGFRHHLDNVYVIGDSPKEIEAARDAGVKHSVAVANGFRTVQELADTGAETVLEDFEDITTVLQKLGVV